MEIQEIYKKIHDIIHPIASKVEVKNQYWFYNNELDDESYCYDCGSKRLVELQKEHPNEEICFIGVNCESDYQEFCGKCGIRLDNTYTTYACECELDYFDENGFNSSSPDDCNTLIKILDSCGLEYSRLSERIQKLCLKVMSDMDKKQHCTQCETLKAENDRLKAELKYYKDKYTPNHDNEDIDDGC